MASLVSSWSSDLKCLPDNYVLPEGKRPGMPVPVSNDIPVIDLGDGLDYSRADMVQQIAKAGQDFGLFQVINHGVSKELMADAMNVSKEFFGMSTEEKAQYYIDSVALEEKAGCRLYTSSGYFLAQGFDFWKDTLQHPCHPLQNHINSWPDKPKNYREVMGPYTTQVRKVAMKIMDMIYQGLGLEADDTEKEFDNYNLAFSINHYPACPDPALALGCCRHSDPAILTLLQQEVYGLQLEKDGHWIGVKPLPDAFVVNIGLLLEVISNGKLKGAVHRAVTNSACSRNSLVTFVGCPTDVTIKPAAALISPTNPPLYRAFNNKDFHEFVFANNAEFEAVIAYLKLKT